MLPGTPKVLEQRLTETLNYLVLGNIQINDDEDAFLSINYKVRLRETINTIDIKTETEKVVTIH